MTDEETWPEFSTLTRPMRVAKDNTFKIDSYKTEQLALAVCLMLSMQAS